MAQNEKLIFIHKAFEVEVHSVWYLCNGTKTS